MGALILAGLVQVARDAQDVFGAAVAASIQDYSIGQYSSVFISIGQYCAVLVSSFRIARCGRGRRAFTGNRAIRMAETEPLMQACYLLFNDVVQQA